MKKIYPLYFIVSIALLFPALSNAQSPLSFHKLLFTTPVSAPDDQAAGDITYGNSGKIYVTGSHVTPNGEEIHTTRMNFTGAVSFTAVNTNINAQEDRAIKVLVSKLNTVYVLGREHYNSVYKDDIVLIKYNSSLKTKIWKRYIFGANASIDNPYDLALANDGNVYVCGTESGTGAGAVNIFYSYSHIGNIRWLYKYNDDLVQYLTTDVNGNVFTAGTRNNSLLGSEIRVAKYDSIGTLKWEQYYNSQQVNGVDYPTDIVTDKFGNVYVSSTDFRGAGVGQDAQLLKYDSTGTFQYARHWGGTSFDIANRVAVDIAGNVYVASTINDSTAIGFDQNVNLRKYNTSGSLTWSHTYAGAGTDADALSDMKVSSAGTSYLTGKTNSSITTSFTLSYTTTGTLQWLDNYPDDSSSVAYSSAQGVSVAVRPASSEACMVGNQVDSSFKQSWFVRRFYPTLRQSNQDEELTENISTVNAFPNPVIDELNLFSESPVEKIIIADIQGKKIKEFVLNQKENKNILLNLSDLPSGVFSCSVFRGKDLVVSKIIKQ